MYLQLVILLNFFFAAFWFPYFKNISDQIFRTRDTELEKVTKIEKNKNFSLITEPGCNCTRIECFEVFKEVDRSCALDLFTSS